MNETTHYLAYYILVAGGRILESKPHRPDVEPQTFAEFSQWLESVEGYVYPVSPHVHTCVDQSHLLCAACESINHPTEPMFYMVMLKRNAELRA